MLERFQLISTTLLIAFNFHITYPCKSFEVEVRPASHLSLDY